MTLRSLYTCIAFYELICKRMPEDYLYIGRNMFPMLYIYINDLPKIMDKLSHTILYADDTNIVVTSTEYNDLHNTVNVTLQLITEWFQIIITFINCNWVVTRWRWLFYMYTNMKKVTRKFKFGGLLEKHVVATWKLGNHLSIRL